MGLGDARSVLAPLRVDIPLLPERAVAATGEDERIEKKSFKYTNQAQGYKDALYYLYDREKWLEMRRRCKTWK